MGCGCKERGQAIVAGMLAIADGDKAALDKAKAEFKRTLSEDGARVLNAARARLSIGRR